MTENGNQMAGRPYGGRNERPEGEGLPGERPVSDEERRVGPPESRDRDDDTASRAAEEGEMSSEQGLAQPTPGIPEPVDAPSPADATEGDPPGGSAANQRGRAPDQ